MIRHVTKLIAIALLLAPACADPHTDALRAGSLAEAIPPDDGNAGEPRRPSEFSTTVAAAACEPGANGGWHHCSAACPCPAGEGDCDATDECAPGLICVKNVGATYGWDPDVDVCEDTCHPSANGGFHYCSETCPCNAGEGDCDATGECAPGLTCVKDIGPSYGWDEDVDVCEDTCHPSANGGFDYCSESCPCGHGEGDCDRNAECMPGLTCVKDVGPRYGWDEDVDVCEGQCDAGDTCSPGCPCAPAGTSLFLQVLALDGQPIPSASVTTMGNIPQPTDGVGRILLDDLAPGRVVARVDALGFAPASVAVDLPAGVHAGAEVRLRPLGPPVPFAAEAGATIEQPAARVTIPPDALVDYQGQPVTGTVEATIVPLDPSQAKSDTLPGPLQGLATGTGAAVELESVVMAEVTLWQDGLPVQLAPGARATLELALPDIMSGRYQTGDSIPAWWLDLAAGIWREEGAGTIQPSSRDPGKLVWVVDVGHFTWWNADQPFPEAHCFTVLVEDAAGNPMPGVQVTAQGVDYGGARSSFTAGDGRACVEILHNGTANIIAGTPSSSLATERRTGSGPASECTDTGAGCTPVTLTLTSPVICTPGTSVPCPYTGQPASTEGVGLCQAGSNQCNADGTAWSGCVGQVEPAEETCSNPFDEDCDGDAGDGGENCEGPLDPDCDCAGCSIGQRIDCYSGPPDTLDVGICRAGRQFCLGRLFGPCQGEVLPAPQEDCETPGDDNCDGSTLCSGITLWSRSFGGTGYDECRGIAVDDAGNVLIAGMFQETVDFGGGPLVGAGAGDIGVAKLDAQGQHLWSLRFGSADRDFAENVATDGAGNVLLAGSFQGTVDFGGGPLSSAGSYDLAMVKLDPQGRHVWSRGAGDGGWDTAVGVAADSAGNVLVAGLFAGAIDLGGGPLFSAGVHDVFVVKLDPQGQHLWSRRFGGSSSDLGMALVLDSAGNVLVTGGFQGTADFGGGPLTSAGANDIFVVKLDAQGQHLWSRRFGGTGNDVGRGIAADSAGNVLLTGYFANTVDFGSGPVASAGASDIFVVKLDAQGQHLWSHAFGSPSIDWSRGVAADGADNVLLTGYIGGPTDFGGGTLFSVGSTDIFAVKLDARGQHLWSHGFGSAGGDAAWNVAVDSAGTVLATGSFAGIVDFGNGPLTSAGSGDIFVLALTP